MDKNVKVVVDTNIIYSRKMEEEFCDIIWGPKLINLENWIATHVGEDIIKIVFPELVIQEVQKQYMDNYQNEKNKILRYMGKNSFPDIKIRFEVEEEFDFKKYIGQQIDQTIEKDIFAERGMELPLDASSLIERAINKRKPFCGENKKSDKGFKDAVLWESIVDYKKNNSYCTLILYTSDRGFSEELVKEYEDLFGEKIFIANDENMLYEYLGGIYGRNTVKEQLNKNCEIRTYLVDNIERIKQLYKEHILAGVWYENVQIVEIKDIYLEDLYEANYEKKPEILYEAVYYVKSIVVDKENEYYKLNLYFYVDIDNEYRLSVMGSGVDYMRF